MGFSDQTFFQIALFAIFLLSPVTVISLLNEQTAYGKHYRKDAGPTLSPAMAWFLMESPTIWLTFLIFPSGRHRFTLKPLLLISFYLLHYLHRTFIYPLRLHKTGVLRSKAPTTDVPLSVVLSAFGFNLLNAYLQTRWVSHYADYAGESDWWFWGRFLVGLAVFLGGMAVNVASDLVLVSLKGADGGYKIPTGGWFELVSCPNYFGEIVEWLGWTVMTWSWAGLGFLLLTCSNLISRARGTHKWYKEKFGEDYPKSRKAVIPFVY